MFTKVLSLIPLDSMTGRERIFPIKNGLNTLLFPAIHEKTAQLLPYQAKLFLEPPFATSPLLGEWCLPWTLYLQI